MKKIIIPIGILIMGTAKSQLSQLPNTENYVQTKTYLDYNGASVTKSSETVQYLDGLGRPKQIINIKASPLGKDVVVPIVYDQFGRQIKEYLPIPQSGTSNGTLVSDPFSNVSSSPYGSEKIYTEKIIENSPLDRVLEQKQVGNDWNTKPVKFGYDVNTTGDNVRKFAAPTTLANGITTSTISNDGIYGDFQLYKNTVADEDENKTIEFKNSRGQVVLVRKVISATENADTYYVYNKYDQLVFVIPPLLSQLASWGTPEHDALAYQYRYDGRNRLVGKKFPGKGWEFMVYDTQDKLVATQDAELNAKGQWLFTKYDQLGRVAYTGISTGGTRAEEQTKAEAFGFNNVNRAGTVGFSSQGMDVYYGSRDFAYPQGSSIVSLLSVNYYDTYPGYSFNPALPANTTDMTVLTDTSSADGRSTRGLPLVSLVKNIEDDNWTKNYTYYDNKGRAVGSHSINHLGGFTRTESKLDFAGLPKQTITRHKRLDSDTERVITETFDYDDQNRLLVHKHQVDSNQVEYLTQNKYNEISQLESKKVGGIAAASPLQQMDYKYNIRGWLTQINDPSNLNGKLFGYEMRYNNPANPLSVGKFNGNITEIDWNNGSENLLKRYNYEYDKLNRLVNAFYKEPSTGNSGYFDEYLTYDLNGNIKTLKRNATPISAGTTFTQIDNLTYRYTGNRLDQVIEDGMNDTGYEGGNNIIGYDLNGSMKDMLDKGIHGIVYNHLNLPNDFSITQINAVGEVNNFGLSYLYRADGTKVRKTYTSGGGRGNTTITTNMTDYLDGFQYRYSGTSICLWCRTSVAYEQEAFKNENINDAKIPIKPAWLLDFVSTAEGFYSFLENRYIYQYKDHLGNTRVSFAKDSSGALEVTDTNNYYAFGMNHVGGIKSLLGGYLNYKYNGKELQESGMYDYGARFYMPDLGRWGVVDPLAEKMTRHSPYNYAFNNPIRFIDPDGRQNEDVIVLGNSAGAKGAGHQAVLVGDNKKGWTYISKDGASKSGGAYGDSRYTVKHFKSLDEFKNSAHNFEVMDGTNHSKIGGGEESNMIFKLDKDGNKIQRYDQAYYINTNDKDSEGIAAGISVAQEKYCLTQSDCSDVPSAVLRKMKSPDGEVVITGEGAPGLLGESPRVKQKWIELRNDGKDIDSKVKPSSLRLQEEEDGSIPKKWGGASGRW
ncbi:DUF6443 domain-containing protein [Chryseobacterium viscerum]|uniref:Sugar-binding protein n=1 Tax=Chryseobacterium viscerum TaxID=1037377 RepID=A0A316WEK6_9FLAO|nr:DUF6443 domain-containing protein [Chryseobacterium viscerum]PWN58536.1 sugar-binding protein [Chryseobacterium viscerum]